MVTMDEDTTNLYIQNLKEYVLDESKTVTYKWLSRQLNLHVNLAKQLLHTFLKQHQSTVHATYLLSGMLNDEVTHKLLVVQEEDLERAKLQFKVLSSEHVYSVQTLKNMADLNTLYIIDRFNSQSDCDLKRLNAVCCNEAVERAADEIARLKIKVRTSAASTDIRARPTAKKRLTIEAIKEEDNIGTTSEEKIGTNKEEKKEVKSGGIAAMFAAQGRKPVKQENTAEKSKGNGKPAPNPKNCFVLFFNKNAEKPKEKSKPSAPVVAKDERKEELIACDETVTSNSPVYTKWRSKSEPVRKEKKGISMKHATEQPKNKKKAFNDPQPSKTRKRILHVSDSESSDSDIFGSDEEEQPPKSPMQVPEPAPVPLQESDEEMVVAAPQSENKCGRKRERRLKVSTFIDADGYVVTKRDYVIESCTDSEGEEKAKKRKTEPNNSEKMKDERKSPSSEPTPKKKCSPQKVKQATLMNFFKKK